MNEYNWKKQAMASAEDLEERTERVFLGQVYEQLEAKAGKLAEDPYRIGFEIVRRNDDNTKIFGMFAFRVGEEIFYAPVFFTHGDIKGTDLLYQASSGTIIPLTKDWAQYLITTYDKKGVTGEGVGKDVASRTPAGVHFERLTYPTAKRGSGELLEVENSFFEKKAGTLLRDFITDAGGFKALAVLEHLASQDIKIAKGLSLLGPDVYAPEVGRIYAEKLASATIEDAPVPRHITVFQDVDPTGDLTDEESKVLLETGVCVVERGEPANTVMTDTIDRHYETISSPGIYKALMANGDEKYIAVIFRYEHATEVSACLLDTGVFADNYEVSNGNVLASPVANPEAVVNRLLSRSARVGDIVHILDTDSWRIVARNRKITGKKTLDPGIIQYTYVDIYEDCSPCSTSDAALDTDTFTINENSDAGAVSGLLGGNKIRFINVVPKADRASIATGTDLVETLVHGELAKPYKLVKNTGGEFSVGTSKSASCYLDEGGMKIALACELDISLADSEKVIEATKQAGSFTFYLTRKNASLGTEPHITGYDNFDGPTFDSYYGAMYEPGQHRIIQVEDNTPKLEEPRIGDGWDPRYTDGLPSAVLATIDTDAMKNLKDNFNVPHIFEHNMFSSLLNVYDVNVFDKYLPDLQQGVDAMGRLLFTFYWKPGVVLDAYGSDDAQNLEDHLLHSFKTTGELLLKLRKKSGAMKKAD